MKVTLKKVTDYPLSTQMKILQWRNSKEVSQYFLINHIDEETHRNWLAEQTQEHPSTLAFFICVDDIPVGCAYFRKIDYINKTAEPGIFMDPKAKGNFLGLGAVAEYLLSEYAFNNLELEKINIEVLDNNPKALSLDRKLGYVDEGCLRGNIIKDGQRHDVYLLGMFADEWEKRRNKIYVNIKDYL